MICNFTKTRHLSRTPTLALCLSQEKPKHFYRMVSKNLIMLGLRTIILTLFNLTQNAKMNAITI